LLADSNGDGLSDLVDVLSGIDPANPDVDGDGVPNVVELAQGTDPFTADSDGDGYSDLVDAFPLDATRHDAPTADPNDHTPPTITLSKPTNATLIGGGPTALPASPPQTPLERVVSAERSMGGALNRRGIR
jgi:hypothetical protein